jgi:hypothetical protein
VLVVADFARRVDKISKLTKKRVDLSLNFGLSNATERWGVLGLVITIGVNNIPD